MTEPIDPLLRLDALQRRRAATGLATPSASTTADAAARPRPAVRRRRRRHPALGGRIAAAGLGATTMFGIITLLGLDNPPTQADGPAAAIDPASVAAPPAAPPIQVVIHRVPTTAPASATTPPTTFEPRSADLSVERSATTAPAAPIELTAQPVVRTVTVQAPPAAAPRRAAAPVATTSGSR